MKPFSNDVIFYDTEFSSLDPYKGEILSIGLVKTNGEELYLELEYDGEYSDWVKNNILSDLTLPKVTRDEAKRRIKEFLGDTKPRVVANVNEFDMVYTHKIFGVEGFPFYWVPVDFASLLFARGIDPERYINREPALFRQLGLDATKYTQHNALDDARLLKDAYFALLEV